MRTGMKGSFDKVALGTTEDDVALGSHLVHFWRTEEEFESGVRFLQLGIDNQSQYCALFGHDEANERGLEILRKTSRDLDRVLWEGRLVVFAASCRHLQRWRLSKLRLYSQSALFPKPPG